MIRFELNNKQASYSGNPQRSLLDFLRNDQHITSAKDGCSGQGACGACTVEINGQAKLGCRVKMIDLQGAVVYTTEGLPEDFRQMIGKMFAEKGAVQCGFCSPGFIMRARALFLKNTNPGREEIVRAVNPNICRCTGYIKIVDAIEAAFSGLRGEQTALPTKASGVGSSRPKYLAESMALGSHRYVNDIYADDMLFGALCFSEHPRARILSIDISEALASPGVNRIITAADIPGNRLTGLIVKDWPMMIAVGEITHCIGDVLACIVADTEQNARQAASRLKIHYEPFEMVVDVRKAIMPGSPKVHDSRSNVLEECVITQGHTQKAFADAAFVSRRSFTTQRIEHAFLETESAVAMPEGDGILIYSQGQGVYVDRQQIASVLNLPLEMVRVIQVPNGGGFGGKEDLSVQGHAALAAWLVRKPVKVSLSREESICMHPKRHPVWMDLQLACDSEGILTAIELHAIGDTGAYASVGTKVMERVVGHATGGYVVPNVFVSAKTVYTNNIPSGAMRGFGVPQAVFALESCIEDLCSQGGFDRWQFRFNNALQDGSMTATGQRLEGVGLRKTLLAVKDAFYSAPFAGLACGIKNTGVGNGMTDESEAIIEVVDDQRVVVHHGWTEMGQGVHTMAVQILHQETGIDPDIIEVKTDTRAGVPTGMTTSSRGTALLGNALINASMALREDLKRYTLADLSGKFYKGKYCCDFTTKPGSGVPDPKIHFAYGYATQLVVLDEKGSISKVVAAHDAGKIMNRMLFEGQMQGSIHMGLGYALTENLPMEEGRPLSLKFKDLGILRASAMPDVEVIGIEEKDPIGPYGAKGIGEIGMVPTAAAVASAYFAFDGKLRTSLPLSPPEPDKMNAKQ